MRVNLTNRPYRERHYTMTPEEIEFFVKIWNDRDSFPEVADIREELCYLNNKKCLNIASQLRDIGYSLIERGLSIISDEDLVSVWKDKKSFPTVKDIGTKYHLSYRWIIVRVSELRAIHGLEAIPYRARCHYDLRKANALKRKVQTKLHPEWRNHK